MLDLGPHTVFIVSAYAGVFMSVIGLIAYAAFDSRRVGARLRDLDARGVRRRSETNS